MGRRWSGMLTAGLAFQAMRLPAPFHACSCRDRETGRLLDELRPELDRQGHGAWRARCDARPGLYCIKQKREEAARGGQDGVTILKGGSYESSVCSITVASWTG
jgi:hypothetical protein